MARQIVGFQAAPLTVLEERLQHLEARVETLTEALRVLARGLEGGPLAEPGESRASEAARQARELLLSQQVHPQSQTQAPARAEPGPNPG
jgi:hypothetical protein